MWSLISLLLALSSVACSEIQHIYGRYGSDLHLNLSLLCQEDFFDVYSRKSRIGNYHDSLKGFNDYKDRLQFVAQNCSFIIRNFSEVDGHNFTFTSYQSIVRMEFEVVVADYRTSKPVINLTVVSGEDNRNRTASECTLGLFALGFSLDSVICLVAIFMAVKMKEKYANNGEIVSHTKKVVEFFRGKDVRNCINLGCIINKALSPVFQISSLILLGLCGNTYGTGWFIAATLITVIEMFLVADWIYFAYKHDGRKNLAQCCYFLEWLQSLAFPSCIFFLYFSLYNANVTLCALIGFSLLSVILKVLIFILCGCMKRITNTTENPKTDVDDGLL